MFKTLAKHFCTNNLYIYNMIKRVIFLLLISANYFAQDTISFKNGLQQSAKVEEVGSSEIKYKRWDNLTGPIYVTAKSEINSIKYSNGVTERYDLTDPKLNVVQPSHNQNPQNQNSQNQNLQNQNPQNQNLQNRLEFTDNKQLFYQQHYVKDYELLNLITSHPNQSVRNNLQFEYNRMMDYKRAIPGFLALGFGIGFAIPIVVSISALSGGGYSSSSTIALIVVGALSGAVVRTLGCAFSKVNNNKMKNQRRIIAELYNNN